MNGARAILFEQVSKMYHKRAGSGSVFSMLWGAGRGASDAFWALRDVSFEVGAGERVGIIGPNGAGKSTVLKILSRVTPPTSGRVKVSGRLASLIEVGSGFHPELSGRENVFLNGAILGMTRPEIRARFDDIVDFAELGEFIDVPVKRYSSGMYVRLGFAVAAHLVTDILLVDEVLAVGDAAFQKKCLGRMEAVAREGRTVVFVSHNMVAVEGLCQRALFLRSGRLVADGPTPEVVAQYLLGLQGAGSGLRTDSRTGSGRARITAAELRGARSGTGRIFMGEEAELQVDVEAPQERKNVNVSFVVFSQLGVKLFNASTYRQGLDVTLAAGRNRWTCRLGPLMLRPGTYRIDVAVGDQEPMDFLQDALTFEVLPADVLGSGRLLDETGGLVYFPFQWRREEP